MFIVYEACVVYSHHLLMFLLFDPIIIDLIFSFHVLLLLSTRPCVVGVLAAPWEGLIRFPSQNDLSWALQNSPPLSERIFSGIHRNSSNSLQHRELHLLLLRVGDVN